MLGMYKLKKLVCMLHVRTKGRDCESVSTYVGYV